MQAIDAAKRGSPNNKRRERIMTLITKFLELVLVPAIAPLIINMLINMAERRSSSEWESN